MSRSANGMGRRSFLERVADFSDETSQRSVDCTLTCILGREAAHRGELLTMADLIAENRRLDVDLSGLRI